MFTGIVQAKGRIRSLKKQGGDLCMTVEAAGLDWASFDVGESISVNGVCLTAAALRRGGFDADVSRETLTVSTLSHLEAGASVNLEPALCAGEPLGGHLVSGHVDCIATVTECRRDARSIGLRIDMPSKFERYIAKKGSICVDSVSLTINEVSSVNFESNIIPHTAAATIINRYAVGTIVNVEVDLLARYIERLISTDGDDISLDFLKAHGYA